MIEVIIAESRFVSPKSETIALNLIQRENLFYSYNKYMIMKSVNA